jgi:hypothetical protein
MTQPKNPHTDGPMSDPPAQGRTGPVVTVTGIPVALWCLGFAAVKWWARRWRCCQSPSGQHLITALQTVRGKTFFGVR